MSSSEHAELVNVFLIACFILAHVLCYCRLISGIGAKSAAAMGDLLDEGLTDLDGAPLRLVARGGGHVARAGGVAVQYGGCGAVQTFQRASRIPRIWWWWCSCSKVEEASSHAPGPRATQQQLFSSSAPFQPPYRSRVIFRSREWY